MADEFYGRLENLLQHKDFAELTTNEKAWVRQHLGSEDAYTVLRITEKQLMESFRSTSPLSPRPETRDALRTRMQATHRQPVASWAGQIFHYRIPAYQAVAGLLLLAAIAFWQASHPPGPASDGGLAIREDTIFVTRHDTVIQEKKVFVVRHKFVHKPPAAPKLAHNHDTADMAVPEQIKNPVAQGVSMEEDTLLRSLIIRKPNR